MHSERGTPGDDDDDDEGVTWRVTTMPVLWQHLEHTNYQLDWMWKPCKKKLSGLSMYRHYTVCVFVCVWVTMSNDKDTKMVFTDVKGSSLYFWSETSVRSSFYITCPSAWVWESWSEMKQDEGVAGYKRLADFFFFYPVIPCLHWYRYYPYFLCNISLCIVNKS